GGTDQPADRRPLVAAEIVHDDDVAEAQGGEQHLLDIGEKADAVDRPVDDAGRLDAVAAQGGEESQRAPAPLWHLGDQTLAALTAAALAGHIGLGPGLVDEDQASRIKVPLVLLPLDAPAGDVGAVLLRGEQAFF